MRNEKWKMKVIKVSWLAILFMLIAQAAYSGELHILVDTSASDYGFIEDGAKMDAYLRIGPDTYVPPAYDLYGNMTDAGTIIDETNSVYLGQFALTSSLVISPGSFPLGPLAALLTDGVDDYMLFMFKSGGTTVKGEKKESAVFSTPSDLIGQTVVSTSFRIDEVRVGDLKSSSDPHRLVSSVYYLDASVGIQAIPEVDTSACWFAVAAVILCLRKKQKRLA